MMNAVAGLRPLQAGEAPQLQPLQHGSGSGKGGQLQRHGSTQAVAGLPTHAQSSPRGGLDRNASTRPSPRQYQQGAAKQLPHCPLPQQIVDFFDRQKSATDEFCNLQRQRVELRHNQVIAELATEQARREQEKANLDYETVTAALARVEQELATLEAERGPGSAPISRTVSVDG